MSGRARRCRSQFGNCGERYHHAFPGCFKDLASTTSSMGMSDRRPSSLARRLALTPATAVHDFLPLGPAVPFLAGQESRSRPSSTALRSLQDAGRSPPVLRLPSRPRWAQGLEQPKELRQWRSSAASPRTATASTGRSRPSTSTSKPRWCARSGHPRRAQPSASSRAMSIMRRAGLCGASVSEGRFCAGSGGFHST